MQQGQYTVYALVDAEGRTLAVNSDAFLADTEGWTAIDQGQGDRYHHAQGNYLPGPVMDHRGVCRYKLTEGEVTERTREEMDADYVPPVARPTAEELLDAMMGGIADA